METRGLLAPETPEEVHEQYEALGPAARTVTKEVARAMEFDSAEYRARVTGDVVATARDALFASLLQVFVGSVEEFESWAESNPTGEIHVEGSDNVEARAWHPAPAADAVAAVTFHEETDAAVATVQRQAFGRYYRDLLEAE